MSQFIRWNSQPLDIWAREFAEGQFIDLGEHRTHFIKKGSGPPVILLHGFFYDSYLWARNIDALAESFEVYALDLWGFGYSTRSPLNYSYELYADQVLSFMNALRIDCASMIGQSMGGGTAIKFCVQHRQRVDKLVLVDAAGLPNSLPVTGKVFNLPLIGELFLGLNSNTIRRKNLADFWIHDHRLITESYFDNVTRFHKITGTTQVLLTILRNQFFDKLSDDILHLSKMKVPSLLVWGREDKAIPFRCGQELHRILQGSRLEIMDDAGHVPNYERADLFNQLTVDFLRT